MRDLGILEPMASEQGWNFATCLLLAIGFLEEQGLVGEFVGYLEDVQREEQEEGRLLGMEE